MAQSVERRIGSAEVTGPIPVSSSHEVEDLMLEVAIEALKLVLPEEQGKDAW